MMKMKSLNVGSLFLLIILLILSGQKALADIHVQGVQGDISGHQCAGITTWHINLFSVEWLELESSTLCSLTSNGYLPKTGYYKVETLILDANNTNKVVVDEFTASFMVDASLSIAQQTIETSGNTASFYGAKTGLIFCQYITNDSGARYTPSRENGCNAGNSTPLLPYPAPDTSCTLNDGNALNVNLNNVDRSQMPTVPGSGSMRHIQVPVECTGGDVTVNMQLNYTPISLSAGEVIKSSSNGLGVSVVYDSKILSSTDITPVTFLAGSNSIDLAFQAVRDPTVEIKDVPTGAFTASAVLVMTQQ